MRKKLIAVLVVLVVLLVLCTGALAGLIWYRNTHVFVGKDAYKADALSLDLTDKAVDAAYYQELHSLLPDCDILWNVPFQEGTVRSDATQVTVQTLSREDMEILQAYLPELRTVYAPDCRDYEALEELKSLLPHTEISYAVDLKGSFAQPDAELLELRPEDFTLEGLYGALPHLPRVKEITLRETTLSLGDVQQLRNDFPAVNVTYTVLIQGSEYPENAQALDLSSGGDVNALAEQLLLLPDLQTLELCDASGASPYTREEAGVLIQAAPQAKSHYSFDFYGVTLTTDMEEVVLKNKRIGDDGEQELREALNLLTGCRRFVLDNCQFSSEVLAQVREDYRGRTKVVWRVWFGNGSCLTDVDVVRCTYDLFNNNSASLYYCEDARYLDIGHNEKISDISFISGMKSLEYAILSGSPIRDLTPLSQCKKLKMLELAYCGYIEDLTPLAECESLTMVNISHTRAEDLTPLENLKLELLSAVGKPASRIPQEQKDAFARSHPDCWITYKGFEYGPGWRYDSSNKQLPWYQEIADAFGYPHPVNNGGWYFQA